MASRVIPFKTAVYDVAQTLIGTDSQVTWDMPTGQIEKRWVQVGQVVWDSSEWITNRTREETFSVKFVISVVITGGTPRECEERAMTLASLVEDHLKANPKLGIPSIVTTGFVPKELNAWPVDNGFEAQFEADIRATARL